MTFLCLFLCALTLAAAAAAMTLRRLVHCALALAAAFAGLAALYVTLDAEFAGLAQLLIYVGAIAILIVFAILLTPGSMEADPLARPGIGSSAISGVVLALAVFTVLAGAIVRSGISGAAASEIRRAATPATTVQQIGVVLIERYVLPLEVVSLMLTAALIGAVILAMKESQILR